MPRISRFLKAAALVAVWATTVGAIRKDEFLCEEAHARLVECCPGFATTDNGYCEYEEGCGGHQFPAISPDESNCIRNASCEKLRSQGVCEKAKGLTAPRTDDDVPSDPWASREVVCQ